jgi:chorismate--pyruvate lyase
MSVAIEAEAIFLNIDGQERCLRRKVSLMSRNDVMFDAESILPLDVLPVELMAELEAGKRPLANLLSDRGLSLSRSGLSVAKIEAQGFYHQCWARRSVLSSESGARALVTEVFHDAIWRKLSYKLSKY